MNAGVVEIFWSGKAQIGSIILSAIIALSSHVQSLNIGLSGTHSSCLYIFLKYKIYIFSPSTLNSCTLSLFLYDELYFCFERRF